MTAGRHPVRRAAAVLAAVAFVGGCSSGGGQADPEPAPALGVPPEHTAPVDDGPMGEVLHSEELDGSVVGGQVWRVLYRSESIAGEPVGVTAIIARPDGPAPDGGFPVLSWAHGTTGIADPCAPSRRGAGGVTGLEAMLRAGYVVAATDYEGLGTPGVHPYLVATSEARSVLDAARAAREVVAETSSRLVVFGVSQGGHAALAAASIAGDRAPELDLAGTVAVAPTADVEAVVNGAFAVDPGFAFAALVAGGWAGTYEDLAAADVLTPAGLEIAREAREELCFPEIFAAAQAAGDEALVSTPPRELEAWRRRMAGNSIDPSAVDGPVLLVHGTADEIIPAALSEVLAAEMCAAGAVVDHRVYQGADHGGAAIVAFPDIVGWAQDRLEGRPAGTTCP